MRAALWLALGALAASSSASADVAMSDTQVAQALVGAWIVSPDSANPKDRQLLDRGWFAVEHFNADGKGDVAIYADKTCTKSLHSETFTWTVASGGVRFDYSDGHSGHVTILSLTDTAFTYTLDPATPPISRIHGDCAGNPS